MRLRRLALALLVSTTLAVLPACSDDSPKGDGPRGDAGDAGVDLGDAGPDAPQVKDIKIPGLSAAVSAVYDERGLLHLYCKTDEDCVAALGYFHAANRFFFMDFARSFMRGKLGEISLGGQLALDQDFAIRQLMTTADGTPIVDDALSKLSSETKALLDRYAAGVNAWLDDLEARRNGAKKTTEYSLVLLDQKRVIDRWSSLDTLAVGLFLINDLGNSTDAELAGADIAANVADPKLVADLLTPRPVFQEFITTGAGIKFSLDRTPQLALEHLRRAKHAIRKARDVLRPLRRRPLGEGSNNWIVGKSLTKNNRALLANDPHLSFTNPAIFFPVEMDAKSDGGSGTFHVAGGSVPGLPFVFVGRNEKLAWGVTTAYYDLNEVYVETLNADGSAVMFNGQQVKLIKKELTFKNAATPGKDVKKTFEWVPHHGPLISKDVANKRGISVRWVPATGLTDPDSFFALMRTEKVADVPQALDKITATNQNFVVIDDAGNIGWFPYGKLPKRPWASTSMPPYLPVPGDGSAEWSGFVALADLPQGQNPPNDFVVTANNANTPATADGDATNDGKTSVPYQALSKAIGARAAQITALIKASGSDHDMASMTKIQGDTESQIAKIVVPALATATLGQTVSADGQKLLDALKAWKLTCPTGLTASDPASAKSSDAAVLAEAIGCTAFHVVLAKVIVLALGDEAKAAGVEFPGRTRLNLVLTGIAAPSVLQSTFWDDVSTTSTTETKDQILRKAIDEAAVELKKINADPAEWIWGRVHTLSMASPLDAFGVKSYNHGPFASPGALGTVNVAAPTVFRDEDFSAGTAFPLDQKHGASIRIVAEGGDGQLSLKLQLPGGTSNERGSKRYNQLLEDFLVNKPLDFAFGKGAVSSPDETLDVKPAQ